MLFFVNIVILRYGLFIITHIFILVIYKKYIVIASQKENFFMAVSDFLMSSQAGGLRATLRVWKEGLRNKALNFLAFIL